MEAAEAQRRADRLKERMRLQKKLREIEKLEAQEAPLKPNQLEKCAKKAELQEALAALGPAAIKITVTNPAGNILASLQMERSSTSADLSNVLMGKGVATHRHRLLHKNTVLKPAQVLVQDEVEDASLQLTLVGVASTHLATATRDGDVMLWDLSGGSSSAMALKGHGHCVTCVRFSPDGQTLLSASADSTAKLWSVESCQLLQTLQGLQANTAVCTADFSPDGLYVVLSQRFGDMYGERPGVTVWRTQDGKRMCSLYVEGEMVGHGATWSPAGDLIATCSGQDNAWVFCAQTGTALQYLDHETSGDCFQAFFSPDGRFVCTVVLDQIYVRRAADMWTTNIRHDGSIDKTKSAPVIFRARFREQRSNHFPSVVISSQGFCAWTGSVHDGIDAISLVTVVDLSHGEGTLVSEIQAESEVLHVEFLTNGFELMVLTTDEPPSLWKVADGTRIHAFGDRVATKVTLSPDGRLASTFYNDGKIMVWNVEDASLLHMLEEAGDVTCASFW